MIGIPDRHRERSSAFVGNTNDADVNIGQKRLALLFRHDQGHLVLRIRCDPQAGSISINLENSNYLTVIKSIKVMNVHVLTWAKCHRGLLAGVKLEDVVYEAAVERVQRARFTKSF